MSVFIVLCVIRIAAKENIVNLAVVSCVNLLSVSLIMFAANFQLNLFCGRLCTKIPWMYL